MASSYGGGVYSSQCWPTIKNSIIEGNSAEFGGGFSCTNRSMPVFLYLLFTNNKAGAGGGALYSRASSKVYVDSCFIVDNGSIDSTKSGLLYLPRGYFNSDTVRISYSHLYYNTFQPDVEIDNNSGEHSDTVGASITVLLLQNNYWWYTDSTAISSLIEGPNEHTPWENNFIPGVPGEPISIDSVRNYSSDFSTVVDYLESDPDTLYLRIYGEDRLNSMQEAAVALIKSNVYTQGVGVALIETDMNSGVYEGKAIIKTTGSSDTIRVDDVRQIVRVDSLCDTIRIVANIDTIKEFIVYYRCTGVEEDARYKIQDARLEIYPNPAIGEVKIEYVLPRRTEITIGDYDISGRLVKTLFSGVRAPGYHKVNIHTSGFPGGIYFIGLKSDELMTTRKLIIWK